MIHIDYGKCSYSRRRKRSTTATSFNSPASSSSSSANSVEGRRAAAAGGGLLSSQSANDQQEQQYHHSNHQASHYHNSNGNGNNYGSEWQYEPDLDSVTWVYERVPGHQLTLIDSSKSNGGQSSGSTFSPTIFSDHSFHDSSSHHSQPEPWARGSSTGNTVPPTDFPSMVSTARYDNNVTVDSLIESASGNATGSVVNNSSAAKEDGKAQRTINEGEEKIIEVRVSSLLRCVEACLQEKSFNCLAANFERVSCIPLLSYCFFSV